MVASVPSLLQGDRPAEEGRATTETPPPIPVPPPVPTPVRPPTVYIPIIIDERNYRSQVAMNVASRVFGGQEGRERRPGIGWKVADSLEEEDSEEEDHPSYINDGAFAIKEHEDMSSLGDNLW